MTSVTPEAGPVRGLERGQPQAMTVGVDIGGTKIAAALVGVDGRIVRGARVPTPRGDGSAVLDAVVALVRSLVGDSGAGAVGVGAPGVIDAESGSVVSATDILPAWAGTPVRPRLEDALGLPVAVDNDVRAMAYGEAHAGSGLGRHRVLYASVGTGIGGALTTAGRLERGAHGTAGEMAHLLTPATGAIPCGCGRFDHLEAVGSGPAMEAAYALRTGRPRIRLPEIVAAIADGDEAARGVVHDASRLFGRVLAGLVAVIDVDAVVIGGGVAQSGPDFWTPLTSAFAAEALPSIRATPLLSARLGTDAPLIGAALLARHRYMQTASAPEGSIGV